MIFRWQVIKTIINVKHLGDSPIWFFCYRFAGGSFDGFDDIGVVAPCMNPITTDGKILVFLCQFVVNLIFIRDYRSGEVLQEVPRMISFTRWLPVIQDDGMVAKTRVIPIYPHISFLTILYLVVVNTQYLDRRLICVNYTVIVDELM